jgi:hypothetical protein
LNSATIASNFDDGATGTVMISLQTMRTFRYTFGFGMPFYIHGSNCYDAHDGGDAPGTRWIEILANMYEAGLHHCVDFVHGAELIN